MPSGDQPTQPKHILWRADDDSNILIDGPQSIADAQANELCLTSCSPLQKPYTSPAPKTMKAKNEVYNHTLSNDVYQTYDKLLQQALDKVHGSFSQPWCLPRQVCEKTDQNLYLLDGNTSVVAAEKLEVTNLNSILHQSVNDDISAKDDPLDVLVSEVTSAETDTNSFEHISSRKRTISQIAEVGSSLVVVDQLSPVKFARNEKISTQTPLGNTSNSLHNMSYLQDSAINTEFNISNWPFFENNDKVACQLDVKIYKKTLQFILPPKSTFMLADCSDSKQIANFHNNIRIQASEKECSKKFDFILLDPPWNNRSAKRKRSSYDTLPMPALENLLHALDLDRLMSDDCLVGVWITNNDKVRNLVLGDNGLFAAWSVHLIQEWLWLKVTEHGEPSSAIDSHWRKPYEVLLIGRRQKWYETASDLELEQKVLMSVPDIHSRKPCLKSLIEPMLSNPSNYRALELFARHLVTGWHSLGNECIRFNEMSCWKDSSQLSVNDGIALKKGPA